MTVIRPNSISGVTSITAHTQSIEFYKSDGTLSGANLDGVNINTAGILTAANFKNASTNVHSIGIDVGSNIKLGSGGIITATSYRGDGSQLTGISAGVSLSNGADNRVITASSASAIQGEANLTFDGSDLSLTGTFDCSGESTFRDRIQLVDSAPEILLTKPSGGLDARILNDGSGNLIFGNGENSDTPQERLRIRSNGKVNITPGGALSGSQPPGDLNIVGTNFLTMTPNDNANASDNEVLGGIAFLPYAAGSIAAASAKIEAVAESGQSGSANPTSIRFYTKPSSAGPGNSGTERLQIASDGNLILQPYNPGSGIFYPYMNVLNGQIKKYIQVKTINSGQGTKFTFTGTDRTSALITIKVSHSWTASNTSNRHGSAIYAVRIFTANGGSAGWDGITLIQAYGYSTGNFVLSNESGYGYSIKVNNPLSDDGVSFCYDIEVMSASNTSKHSLTSVTIA